MSAHGPEEVAGFAHRSRYVPEKLIRRRIREEASSQNDGREQENKTSDFLSDSTWRAVKLLFSI